MATRLQEFTLPLSDTTNRVLCPARAVAVGTVGTLAKTGKLAALPKAARTTVRSNAVLVRCL
jgi:hypothetical protein